MTAPQPQFNAPAPRGRRSHIPTWKIAVGTALAMFLVIGAAMARRNQDSDPAPGSPGTTEFCVALGEPRNVILHPSDWRRIGHWSQREMEAYVLDRCPELISRVRS